MAGVQKLLRGGATMVWSLREVILAGALALWLSGYFLQDGWEQRRAVVWLVPVFLLNGDLLVKAMRETRWLWAVAALLVFQTASRLWSTAPLVAVATPTDALTVLALTTALVVVGRSEVLPRGVLTWLVVLAGVVTLFSLGAFYLAGERSLAGERLRNPFIYVDGPHPGLNAVLTGMLSTFGAVGAAWGSRERDWRLRRWGWWLFLAVLVFGLMASQSRGAMLALAVGLGVLLCFRPRALWPALVTALGTATVYFVAVASSAGGVDLVERGATGRFAIYRWFLARTSVRDALVGRGMGSEVSIPEGEFGWLVHHPHSAYLTQFVLTGGCGLALLGLVLAWAGWRALREAWQRDELWLALLASGAAALLFDCAQIFTLQSAPRLEYLLLVVPAALVVGRARGRREVG